MVRRRLVVLAITMLVPVVIGILLAIYDERRIASAFVLPRDACIAARTAPAQSSVAGRLSAHVVRVGEEVREGEIIAWVSGPSGLRVNVRAPLSGTVLGQYVDEGGAVGGGQTVATVGDLAKLWVAADVDESRSKLVRIGQPAKVRVTAAGLTLDGTVASVAPVTQAALSAGQPADSAPPAGACGKAGAAQTIPVRIALDEAAIRGAVIDGLKPGMQASVQIDVR